MINKIPKGKVRKCLTFIFILISVGNNIYSQDYDLIVTPQNDSIACHIDSISVNRIYFKMRYKSQWVHTYFNKDQVLDYKLKELNRKEISFIKGTSYIKTLNSEFLKQYNRNTIYGTGSYLLYHYTLNMNYERVFFISDTGRKIWSFRVGYGIINNDGKIVLGTLNNLTGKGKNKFEMNFGLTYINEPHSYGPNFVSIVLNAGYRLQSPDGKFVLRTGIGTPEGLYLSFGYSF